MQNYCKTIGALAAASALVAGNASAEVEYEIHTGYSSAYLFRGIDTGDHLIEAGADVSTQMYGLDLSAGAWYGSFEGNTPGFGPGTGSANADELDIYAEFSKDLGFANVAVGYIYYAFPQGQANNLLNRLEDRQEVYFSVSKEFFGLNTSLTYFWEVEDAGSGTGGYMEAYVGKSFELSQCLTLNTGATLAYLVEENEFAHITTKVSLDWAFTETATLSPYIAASWGLTNDANSNVYANVGEEFVAGALLSVSF